MPMSECVWGYEMCLKDVVMVMMVVVGQDTSSARSCPPTM